LICPLKEIWFLYKIQRKGVEYTKWTWKNNLQALNSSKTSKEMKRQIISSEPEMSYGRFFDGHKKTNDFTNNK
jgi:hypothetical protein